MGGSPGTDDTTPSVTGPATTNASGVFTTFGGVTFTKTGGNLVITSFYARIKILTGFNSIELFGDVENRGTRLECGAGVTLAIDGYSILTVTKSARYKSSSGLNEYCIPPGGKGVFTGIDNNAASTLLDHPSSVTYAFKTDAGTDEVPHPAEPSLIGATVDHGSGRYKIVGTLLAKAADIHLVQIDLFVRDSSGLLREWLLAYPGNSGTIAAGSQTPFASGGTDAAFSRFVAFTEFSEGPATAP